MSRQVRGATRRRQAPTPYNSHHRQRFERIRARIGKAREDLPWQETKLDPEFVSYVRRFPDEQLPRIRELLDARPSGCRLVELRSREEAERAIVPGGLLWKLANPVSQLDT